MLPNIAPNNKTMKEYFKAYLENIIGLQAKTVQDYLSSINFFDSILKQKKIFVGTLYEVDTLEELKKTADALINDADFIAKNISGHNRHKVVLQHYLDFSLRSEGFEKDNNILKIDIPIPVAGIRQSKKTSIWKRDRVICQQVIVAAHFLCEIGSEHKTFMAKETNRPYMEGHHIIPLAKQESFFHSLDVYANIISLCPVCHRLLHYGTEKEKLPALKKIWLTRQKRLTQSGLNMDLEHFLSYTL